VWILVALLGAPLVHAIATLLFAAVGGHPTQWFYLPNTPELAAALVVFPLGEEFGWRGFAHPRLVARFGAVRGCLILGAVWGLWHLAYSVTPEGRFDLLGFGLVMAALPFYSVLLGWLFERADRSMAVAIAGHVRRHLDKFDRAPRADLRLQVLHLFVGRRAGGRGRPARSPDAQRRLGRCRRIRERRRRRGRFDVVKPAQGPAAGGRRASR
jgi:hypothetical protein